MKSAKPFAPVPVEMSRRSFIRHAAGASAAGAALFTVGPTNALGNTEIRVQYDWLMGNGQIGEIVSAKKGYYAEEGLSVTFGPGGPNAQTVAPLLSGQAQFAQFSTTNQFLLACGAGRPLKLFACGYQYSPYAYFSLPKSPVRTPKDFIGKTVAVNPNGRQGLNLILSLHKIDPASVRVVTMGTDMTALIAGQVDVAAGFLTNTKALSVLGADRIVMTSEDAGVTGYANPYFTSAEKYEGQKDVLARFLRATAKGWKWAYENRQAAVDIMCEAYPNLEKQTEYDTVDAVMRIAFTSATKEKGWGWFSDERLGRQLDLYSAAGFLTASPPTLANISTHEILERTSAARPRIG
jgi:NitT/TauT family transport system substrate-binding protein